MQTRLSSSRTRTFISAIKRVRASSYHGKKSTEVDALKAIKAIILPGRTGTKAISDTIMSSDVKGKAHRKALEQAQSLSSPNMMLRGVNTDKNTGS